MEMQAEHRYTHTESEIGRLMLELKPAFVECCDNEWSIYDSGRDVEDGTSRVSADSLLQCLQLYEQALKAEGGK